MARPRPKPAPRSAAAQKRRAAAKQERASPEWAVLSDIHSNLHALQAVLAECERRKISRFLCLGDTVGYAAYPAECLRLIRGLKGCRTVIGNHDHYVSQCDVSGDLNTVARAGVQYSIDHLTKSAREWLGALPAVIVEESFTAVHASLEEPLEWDYILTNSDAAVTLHLQTTPVCFYGHTHHAKLFASGRDKVEQLGDGKFRVNATGRYLVNPGSVGQPRGGDPRPQFIAFDPREFTIEFVKVDYNIDAAGEAIIAAGLPPYLAERLQYGV
jgi:predicted phosphodiesterase